MLVTIQLSDAVYKALLAGQSRIQGTLGLVSPTEGNFNAHHKKAHEGLATKVMRLPHGRASVTEDRVSLTLHVDRRERGVMPHQVIDIESQEACDFIYVNV